MHQRLGRVGHFFQYPTSYLSIDLDELPEISAQSTIFKYNSYGVLSIADRDFLPQFEGSLRERVGAVLRRAGSELVPDRITLVTSPRLLGYVFNPVSFFYLWVDGSLGGVIAEVKNTFSERHIYVLLEKEPVEGPFLGKFSTNKAFHVSPFYDLEGRYEFFFGDLDEISDIRINKGGRVLRDGSVAGVEIKTRLFGEGVEVSDRALLRCLLVSPFRWWLTFPRIVFEAVRLRFLRRLKVYSRPVAQSDWTLVERSPSFIQRIAKNYILGALKGLSKGSLTLTLPDGTVTKFGAPEAGVDADLKIRDWRFFSRVLFRGDVGFGESYTSGEWESSNLTDLVRLFIDNWQITNKRAGKGSAIGLLLNRLFHLFRDNTLRGSRKNISAHYDLSNDLYKLFLDQTMTYSCAIHGSPDEPLEEAQLRKLRMLIEKARITSSDHVLEIGSGWGSFALLAAKETGCRVTSLTLSEEQLRHATELAERSGLSDRVQFKLCDYRQATGKFDKIVSIEMLEAVGERHLGGFFAVCDSLLKPNGLLAVQVITMPEERYELYRRSVDWIQRYIFPGAFLPSVSALISAITSHSRFVVEDLENIGANYAVTLKQWRDRFLGNIESVKKLGFDDQFIRSWEYYLSYCEAGFKARAIGDIQIVLTRPGNTELPETGRAFG